ncbi:MAG TPA: hypothetical protein VFT79_12405 [Solirubrobacterales bacterium]|nr:hypothetical protein [Solirubrobacterales bacterium]
MISLAGIVVGAALSLAGLVSDGGPNPEPEPEPSPTALAALLRQGPFSKSLPEGLEASELASADPGDSSAAGRVDAMELVIENTPSELGVYAHLEVYPSADAALKRAAERVALLKEVFGADKVQGDASSYCSIGTIHGPDAWECGGTSGLAYAEATVYPNVNATQSIATGISAALLSYADEKAQIAAG